MALDDRHEPIFVFDSREEFMPVAVESVEAIAAEIVNPDGTPGGGVALDDLPAAGGWMNLPPDPRSYEKEMERRFGQVGYRRAIAAGGLTWVQYWLWYLYNPKKVIVTGNHEGDWEFVQIGYAGDRPVCMTASQHRAGGSRMWWEIEREVGRPVVYVALGSHANYFEPVDQLPEVGDDGDGKGSRLDQIEWREFGIWTSWPGQWGNSRGQGHSPDSPGNQGDRWAAPHRYHSKAKHQP